MLCVRQIEPDKYAVECSKEQPSLSIIHKIAINCYQHMTQKISVVVRTTTNHGIEFSLNRLTL